MSLDGPYDAYEQRLQDARNLSAVAWRPPGRYRFADGGYEPVALAGITVFATPWPVANPGLLEVQNALRETSRGFAPVPAATLHVTLADLLAGEKLTKHPAQEAIIRSARDVVRAWTPPAPSSARIVGLGAFPGVVIAVVQLSREWYEPVVALRDRLYGSAASRTCRRISEPSRSPARRWSASSTCRNSTRSDGCAAPAAAAERERRLPVQSPRRCIMPVHPDARELGRRWFEEVWNARREESIDELMAPDAQGHVEGGEYRGPEGFRQMQQVFLSALPDVRIEIEDIVADGNRAAVRWRAYGTHAGDGFGFEATHRPIDVRGTTWLVAQDGKIVEGWDTWNLTGLVTSLGQPDTVPEPRF